MVQGAENLGFATPINRAKRDLEQFQKIGKIVYPFLGIRYVMITPEIQEEKSLPVDYGALIIRGNKTDEVAIVPGSAAEKAGLQENDIILEVNGEKITTKNKLSKAIQKYNPGDVVKLKVMRDKKIKYFTVKLGEKSS
jgi:serine protease Do